MRWKQRKANVNDGKNGKVNGDVEQEKFPRNNKRRTLLKNGKEKTCLDIEGKWFAITLRKSEIESESESKKII